MEMSILLDVDLMASNDYVFVAHWDVPADIARVDDILIGRWPAAKMD